jgi:hypothetical protein
MSKNLYGDRRPERLRKRGQSDQIKPNQTKALEIGGRRARPFLPTCRDQRTRKRSQSNQIQLNQTKSNQIKPIFMEEEGRRLPANRIPIMGHAAG